MRNLLLATTCACLLGILTAACGGEDAQPPPSQSAGGPRLAWDQFAPGVEELGRYSFVLYVDGNLVPLPGATCGALAVTSRSAQCTSPLPALSAGEHTLEMAARTTDNGVVIESARSAPITYTAGGASASSMTEGARASGAAAALVAPGARSSSLSLPTVISTSDGLAFAVDIVAESIKGPAQLARASDGRLFVAEADGRVRVIRPGARDTDVRSRGTRDSGDIGGPGDLTLDARALLDPPPIGPMGLALHPDFAKNHLVYVAFLAQDSRERAALRVVRLREVGGTFGEAATLFEAPLTVKPAESDGPDDGPRAAFGPDGLLYLALPPGVEFDREPAASTPQASMLRLRDDGRVPPDLAALEGVPASPVGFDWHPANGALWAVFPSESGGAELWPVTDGGAFAGAEDGRAAPRWGAAGGGRAMGALRFQRALDGRQTPVMAFVAVPDNDALNVVTFAEQVRTEPLLAGMLGRIGDMVAGDGGTLFLVTRNGSRPGELGRANLDVIVRLTPQAR